jgi:hypothetical protein
VLLEAQKRKAVDNENYEDAKVINEKIKKLREGEVSGPTFPGRPGGTPSDYLRQKKTVSE